MSRSILLLICDFLLISLLALANFDRPEETASAEEQEEAAIQEQPGAQQDLIEMLKLSLEVQESESTALQDKLSETEEELLERDEKLSEMEEDLELTREDLTEKEKALLEREKILREVETEKERLARIKAELEEKQSQLSDDFLKTRSQLETIDKNRQELADQLAQTREQAAVARERAAVLQATIRQKDETLQSVQENMQNLKSEFDDLENETNRLSTELKIKDTEKRLLEQNLVAAHAELETVKVEKKSIQRQADRLAEGVNQLAETTSTFQETIQEEIKQIQPVSPNVIFSRFRDNRIDVGFVAKYSGMLGDKTRNFVTRSIFITDGVDNYAVFHVNDSPFRIGEGASNLESVRGVLKVGERMVEVTGVSFLNADPRIMAVRVPPQLLEEGNVNPIPLAQDVLRFSEVVLIGKEEGYYGEAPFKLDAEHKQILRMEPKLFKKLFGEFTPSRSDLVFSKTGGFVGVMVTGDTAVLVENFNESAMMGLGKEFNQEETRIILDALSSDMGKAGN